MKSERMGLWLGLLCVVGANAFAQDAVPAAPESSQTPETPETPETLESSGTRPSQPPAYENVSAKEALAGAVAWLVLNQNEDGSWGSHHSPRPIEVLADVPGSHDAFRIATTSLCVLALQECPAAGEAGFAAAERGIDYLLANYDVKRASLLEHYNVWSFGYTLQCFGERLETHPEDPRAIDLRRACKHLLKKLDTYQTLDGGWGYLSLNEVRTYKPSFSSMSFTTATILVGLDRVRRVGIDLDPAVVSKAVEHLKRSRLSDGAFLYGEYLKFVPRMEINERKGSACRTPLCHYALDLFGEDPQPADAYPESLRDLLIRYAEWQRASLRRPIPHEAYYSISGYFYLYGHAYAAYVLEQLSDKDQAALWPELVRAVLRTRQPDGSFWDYPLYSYHKPYGTAFAVIALSRVPENRVQ